MRGRARGIGTLTSLQDHRAAGLRIHRRDDCTLIFHSTAPADRRPGCRRSLFPAMSRAHERALAALAHEQHGLLTAADLSRVTGRPDELRRRLRGGAWQQVLPGVVVPAAVQVSRDLLASAAVLWAPDGVLSHHEAARREGIWVPEPGRLRIAVPFASPKRSVARVEVVRTRHLPEDVRTDGFHRWTAPARTVVDLGMVLTRRQLEAVLLAAVRRGGCTAAEVEAAAAELPGRAGLADVRAVTALWAPERESLLEDGLVADLTAAVPEPVVRQHKVFDARGRLVARVDAAIVELRIAFEADGLFYHSTTEQIASDQQRDRELLRLGWLVVRYREEALADHAAVRREVAALVARRRLDVA